MMSNSLIVDEWLQELLEVESKVVGDMEQVMEVVIEETFSSQLNAFWEVRVVVSSLVSVSVDERETRGSIVKVASKVLAKLVGCLVRAGWSSRGAREDSEGSKESVGQLHCRKSLLIKSFRERECAIFLYFSDCKNTVVTGKLISLFSILLTRTPHL